MLEMQSQQRSGTASSSSNGHESALIWNGEREKHAHQAPQEENRWDNLSGAGTRQVYPAAEKELAQKHDHLARIQAEVESSSPKSMLEMWPFGDECCVVEKEALCQSRATLPSTAIQAQPPGRRTSSVDQLVPSAVQTSMLSPMVLAEALELPADWSRGAIAQASGLCLVMVCECATVGLSLMRSTTQMTDVNEIKAKLATIEAIQAQLSDANR